MELQEVQAIEGRRDRVNWLSAPGLVVVIIVTQIPFVLTLVLSFLRWNVRRPDLPITFIGLENFVFIATDRDFYTTVINTFILTIGGLALATVMGFALALAFSDKFPGSSVARSLLIIPYFVMEPVIGIVWKTLMLSPTLGLNAAIAELFGIEPISFFGPNTALMTITFLVAWQWTPFLFLILLSGLQGLSEDVLESARVDGAGFWRLVFNFKIPLLMPYFKVACMFGLINILKVFGIIFVTTQGGPGVASANLPYYIYRTGFYDWQVGRSAAISVVVVILTLIVINVFFRLQGDVTKRAA